MSKVLLTSLTNSELIEHVAEKVAEFKRDVATGNHYGDVKLSDIQAYSNHMQRAQFSPEGRTVMDELQGIIREYMKLTDTVARTREPINMCEVYKRIHHYGHYNRKA